MYLSVLHRTLSIKKPAKLVIGFVQGLYPTGITLFSPTPALSIIDRRPGVKSSKLYGKVTNLLA